MRLDTVDEEAEIRCRERGISVGEILCREKISNVDCVEERLHDAVVEWLTCAWSVVDTDVVWWLLFELDGLFSFRSYCDPTRPE